MSAADAEAGGIETSRSVDKRDAVSGYEGAEEFMMARSSCGDRVVGGEVEEWKRSGYVDSPSVLVEQK